MNRWLDHVEAEHKARLKKIGKKMARRALKQALKNRSKP